MAERGRFTRGKPFTSGDILRIIFKNLSMVQMKEVFCVILAITRNLAREQSLLEKLLIGLLTDVVPTAKVVQTALEILEFGRKKGEFQLNEAD